MKKKVEFLGGDTEQDENYWEYEEYVEKKLILNGTGVITKEGMIHLEESLNEKLEGFDFLPGLMIIPQSNMRTLRQVVYQELQINVGFHSHISLWKTYYSHHLKLQSFENTSLAPSLDLFHQLGTSTIALL